MLLKKKKQWVSDEIRGNLKIPQDKQWKHNLTKSTGCSKSSSKREVHSNTGLPQETRKISNKQSNPTPNATRERKKQNPMSVEGKKS